MSRLKKAQASVDVTGIEWYRKIWFYTFVERKAQNDTCIYGYE